MKALLEAFDLLGPHSIGIAKRPEDLRGRWTIAFFHEAPESKLNRVLEAKEFSKKVRGKKLLKAENKDLIKKRKWFFTRLRNEAGKYYDQTIPSQPGAETGYQPAFKLLIIYNAAFKESRGRPIAFQIDSGKNFIAAQASNVELNLTALKKLFLGNGYHYRFDVNLNTHLFEKLSGMQKPAN